MIRKFSGWIFIIMILSISSVMGSQIIRFRSGTVLVAQSHRIEGKMIYVTLEKGNEVGFPLSLVEKIEERSGYTTNTTLFNRKNSGTPGNSGIRTFSGPKRFPPGFTSEIDETGIYRKHKRQQPNQRNSGTFYSFGSRLDARKKLRSALSSGIMGSSRGTTTTAYQGKHYNISVKTSRHSPSGKQGKSTELRPKIPSRRE